MFANLKNKILEEVKASPQKIQQIAQAAQAAVSSASSTASEPVTGNDNFFSITEEDTPQNSPQRNVQFDDNKSKKKVTSTNSSAPTISVNNGITINPTGGRARKLSSSSMASDVSFRLPPYDSPAIHHLQSDLDVSASEVEDSPVISINARLDVISKEQIHDAYIKAMNRYQKYRMRYTDLVKQYRDLEHDSTKAREVLVETQDKAIRRINELKEQCNLEQEAKAHLEEALRMEMDDMQCKISAYQTKLKLLGENPENITEQINKNNNNQSIDEPLIELDSSTSNERSSDINLINHSDSVIQPVNDNNEMNFSSKINELEIQLNEKNKEIDKLQKNLEYYSQKIDELEKIEYENAIQIATNKMVIHSELEKKENEVKKLKDKITKLEKNIEQHENDKVHLEKQIIQLPELHDKIKQLTESKQELNAKLISNEHLLNETKKDIKEKNKEINDLKKSNEQKIEAMKIDYEEKIEKLKSQNENLNNEIQKFNDEICNLKKELDKNKSINDEYEKNLSELQEEVTTLRNQRDEAKKYINSDNNEQKIKELHDVIISKDNELKNSKDALDKIIQEMNDLLSENNELKNKLKYSDEQIKNIQEDKNNYEQIMEKEKFELKSQINNILQEITRMEDEMNIVKKSHEELEKEKHILEEKFEKMTKENQENLTEDNIKWQNIIKNIEDKLKLSEMENKKLNEKILMENDKIKEYELLLKQNEINYKKEKSILNKLIKDNEINYNTLRIEYEKNDENLKIINEKMSEILDENSRLHNAKELMEHEYRSLQDKYNAFEKEKNSNSDLNKCLQNDNEQLKIQLNEIKNENFHLQEQLNNVKSELENYEKINYSQKCEELMNELKQVKEDKEILDKELKILKDEFINKCDELNVMKQVHLENESLKNKISNFENEYEKMKMQLNKQNQEYTANVVNELKDKYNKNIELNQIERDTLNENLKDILNLNKNLTEKNNQNEIKIDNLIKQITIDKENYEKSIKNYIDNEKKIKKFEEIKIENQYLNTEINQLRTKLDKYMEEINILEKELNNVKLNENENEIKLKLQIDNLNDKINKISKEYNNQLENVNILKEKNDNYEKNLKIYDEKLNEKDKLYEKTYTDYKDILNENEKLMNTIEIEENKLKEKLKIFEEQNETNKTIINDLTKQLVQATKLLDKLQNAEIDNDKLQKRIQELEIELKTKKHNIKLSSDNNNIGLENVSLSQKHNHQQNEINNLRDINERLQNELDELKHKSMVQISNLNQEIDDLTINTKQLYEKLNKFDIIKEQNDQLIKENEKMKNLIENKNDNIKNSNNKLLISNNNNNLNIDDDNDNDNDNNSIKLPLSISNNQEFELIKQEKNNLEIKLDKIMHEVQDVSNRNLFLEQKCENYLILEQSNERLKLANEKLSRQLDETLVSLQHNEGISANTEFEYLRNIMFQYLTGTVTGNNETLVKVIAAVLKFSPQQTQVAIEKEHQRHSLFGQFNNIL